MITFEEARNSVSTRYDIVEELEDAWFFTWEGAGKLEGGDQGYYVLKDTGKILRPAEYLMRDAVIYEEEE